MNPIAQLQKFTKLVKQPEDAQKFDAQELIRVEKKKWLGLCEFTFVYLNKSSYQVGWMVDDSTNHCLSCQNSFTIISRKHHCRSCGIIICSSCCNVDSTNSIQLGISKFEPKGSKICTKFCGTGRTTMSDPKKLPTSSGNTSTPPIENISKNGNDQNSPTPASSSKGNTPASTPHRPDLSLSQTKSSNHDTDKLISIIHRNQKLSSNLATSNTTDVPTIASNVSKQPTKSRNTTASRVKIEYTEKPRMTSNNTKFLGVKLSYFAQFIKENGGIEVFKNKSTGDVCREFIHSSCERTEMSVCQQLKKDESTMVGFASWFISHSWSYLFLDTVDAITRKLAIEYGDQAEDVYVWFDLFSLPQVLGGKLVTHDNYLKDTYTEYIIAIKNVMMVLSTWKDPIALKRAWCVYELFICNQTDGHFDVAFPGREVTDVINFACSISSSSSLSSLQHQKEDIFCIDTASSTAEDQSETELIHNEIKNSIGFKTLDMSVKETILKVRARAASIKLKGEKLEKQGKLEQALLHYEEVLMLRSLLKVDVSTLLTVMIFRARVYLKLYKSDEMYIPVLELYKKYGESNQVMMMMTTIKERIHKHIKKGDRGVISLQQLYVDLHVQSSNAVTKLLFELELL